MSEASASVARHQTAIRRKDLSLPVKCAVADRLIGPAVTVLDFGCGHGENIENPILHRKEAFVTGDPPLREKFARLTGQDERYGLLDDTATIGTREGWQRRLEERQVELRGHRVVRRKGG